MRHVNADSNTMIVLGFGVATLLALAPATAGAAKFKVLYSQCAAADCADGRGGSTGPLVMDAAGNFFGTTPDEKAFVLKRSGKGKFTYKVLLSFVGEPIGGMIIDTQRNLYGWAGSFYKMTYGPFKRRNRRNVAFPPLNCSTPLRRSRPNGDFELHRRGFGRAVGRRFAVIRCDEPRRSEQRRNRLSAHSRK